MERASYCKQDFEHKCSKSDHKFEYNILYAAIQEDDDIKTSRIPHILKEAKQCILIHSWQQLASTIDYDTYLVQCINQNGEVHSDKLDNDYSIHIYPSRFSTWASISLKRDPFPISVTANQTLERAQDCAERTHNNSFVTLEYVIYSLVDVPQLL